MTRSRPQPRPRRRLVTVEFTQMDGALSEHEERSCSVYVNNRDFADIRAVPDLSPRSWGSSYVDLRGVNEYYATGRVAEYRICWDSRVAPHVEALLESYGLPDELQGAHTEHGYDGCLVTTVTNWGRSTFQHLRRAMRLTAEAIGAAAPDLFPPLDAPAGHAVQVDETPTNPHDIGTEFQREAEVVDFEPETVEPPSGPNPHAGADPTKPVETAIPIRPRKRS